MPSPYFNVSIVSRSQGRNAIASASYRHATQMMDRGQQTRDYSSKTVERVHSEIALPERAYNWV